MERAWARSISRTVAPLYGLMVTSPVPASVFRASRTGVLDTPSSAARSVSTSARPGVSSPVRIACFIASSTASVRDGSAPGLDPVVENRASGMGAPGGVKIVRSQI